MAEQEPNPNFSMATYGFMPDQYQQNTLRHSVRAPTAASTPYATLPQLRLEAATENEIGDLVLKSDPESGEE